MHRAQKNVLFCFCPTASMQSFQVVYFNFCILKDLSAQPNVLRRALEVPSLKKKKKKQGRKAHSAHLFLTCKNNVKCAQISPFPILVLGV